MVLSSGGQNTIRVLVIDDRTVVREGLRLILGADPLFEVIAMVGGPEAGIAVGRETHPDVVLMELPPRTAGGELVRSLHQELPEVSIVILTDQAKGEAVAGALREGAVAYIAQDATADGVRSTIRRAAPRWRARTSPTTSSGDSGRDVATLLTKREHEVLARIAEGKPNRVIAMELGITSETVKTYVKRVMGKLRVGSRTEAAVLALTTGMVQAMPVATPRGGDSVAGRYETTSGNH
jgi:two-component system, NarL family, response regulator LiaR